jgi:NAD(P)-dependent dehydrogenase (short-subunit alcohol dehydrogenase family)
MDLTGRTVLLTGAKRIGAAVAEAVAARGAEGALAYGKSRAEADATAAAIERLGRRAIAVQTDVTSPESCAALIGEIDRSFGRLDVVVAMASRYDSVPLSQLTSEAWNKQIGVDLGGTFQVALAAVPLLRRTGGGRIITFSDWLAVSGRPRYPGYLAYYVAKAGVKALTEALALEVAGDQILVNAVAPGPIMAPPGTSDEESAQVERATPLGRWGGVEPIVAAVLAFIDNDFMTGETVRVDGGRHLR